jgi:hypothetical protein
LNNFSPAGEWAGEAFLEKKPTSAADGKTYQVEYFDLDAILSVGYRVNSKRGTQFRIWATRTLRDHLVQGYTLNERRLREKGLTEMEQAVGCRIGISSKGGRNLRPQLEVTNCDLKLARSASCRRSQRRNHIHTERVFDHFERTTRDRPQCLVSSRLISSVSNRKPQ